MPRQRVILHGLWTCSPPVGNFPELVFPSKAQAALTRRGHTRHLSAVTLWVLGEACLITSSLQLLAAAWQMWSESSLPFPARDEV